MDAVNAVLAGNSSILYTLNHWQIKLHIFGGSCDKISTPEVHESIMEV
jgi:hypothetical protein